MRAYQHLCWLVCCAVCSTGTSVGDTCFAMGQNEWRAFVTDCGLANIPSSTNPTPRHEAPYPTTTSTASPPRGSSQPHAASPHDHTPHTWASAPAVHHAGGNANSSSDHAGAAVPRVPPLNLSAAAMAAGAHGGGGPRGHGTVPRASGRGVQHQQQGHGATRGVQGGGQGGGHGRAGGASSSVHGGGAGVGVGGGWSQSASLALLQTADLVFEAVNFEDDKSSAEAKVRWAMLR